MKQTITAYIVARNEEKNISACLDSLEGAVDEIIVVDGESTDNTAAVSRERGARVFSRKPWGYAEPDRQFALEQATGDWVLAIDADERLTPALAKALRSLVEKSGVSAYRLPRRNYFYSEDRWLRHGWAYPDYQIRLLRKDSAHYPTEVHSVPKITGKLETSPFAIEHRPGLQTWDVFRRKWLKYARIQAKQMKLRLPRPFYGPNAFVAFILFFSIGFFVRLGFLDGFDGFTHALMWACNQFMLSWYIFTGR